MSVMRLNSSPERWVEVPVPEEAKVILPRFALACATNSMTDFAGEEFGTTMRLG